EAKEDASAKEPMAKDSIKEALHVSSDGKAASSRSLILGVPCQDAYDALALEMFKEFLEPRKFHVQVAAPATLFEKQDQEAPAAFLLSSFAVSNPRRARMLAAKIHAAFPQSKIIIGCWNPELDAEETRNKLVTAGAGGVATSFQEARRALIESKPDHSEHL